MVFEHEISLIKNESIRKFVSCCLEKYAADYFYTAPCSTSGKYHPQVSLGKGGIIRHTKLAVWWGIELARALELERFQDELIAALILHDIRKNGKALGPDGRPVEDNVTATHGVLTADIISDDSIITQLTIDQFRLIYYGIACHMGRWTDDKYEMNKLTQPKLTSEDTTRQFAMLVHLADYCASRKVDNRINMLMKEKDEAANTK